MARLPAIADQTTLMYVLHLGVGDDFTFTPEGHPRSAPAHRRRARRQRAAVGADHRRGGVRAAVPAPRGLSRLDDRDAAGPGRPRSRRTSKIACRTSASTSSTRTSDGRRITRWRTPTSPRSRRSDRWDCCSAPSASARCWRATCSSAAARSACCAPSATPRRTCAAWCCRKAWRSCSAGLLLGTGCAVVAILPALRDRAQSLPLGSLATLLIGVVITGAIASLVAIKLTTRTPVVDAIKSE